MKKQMIYWITVLVIILAQSVSAQKPEISGYGGRGIIGLPSGNFGEFTGVGIGGVGTVFSKFDDKLTFTGSVGFVRFGGDNVYENFNWTIIPLMSGARYFLSPENATTRYYVGGDLGYFVVNISGDGFLGGSAGSEFTLGPAVGVQLNKLDIRAVYYLNSIQYLALEVGIALTK